MPETRQQSKTMGGSAPKNKAKTVPPARKEIFKILGDTQSVIFTDYLDKGKTINRILCCITGAI